MKYINAVNIIPDELLVEIRRYISEGLLYIPGINERKEWGSITGQKYELKTRNQLIRRDFHSGKTVNQISRDHFLTKSSIYRILKDSN